MTCLNMYLNLRLPPKIPVLHQSESADCGIACIAMILGYYGHQIKTSEIKRNIPSSFARGMSVHELTQVASGYNLIPRPIRLCADELKNTATPIILHWNFDHYVIYERSNDSSVTIIDPAIGRRKLNWKDFSRSFTGVAIDFEVGDSFQTRRETKQLTLTSILSRRASSRHLILWSFFYTALFQAMAFGPPFLIQFIVDRSIGLVEANLLILACILLVTATLFQGIFSYLKMSMLNRLSVWIEYDIAQAFMQKIFSVCPTFFEGRFIGEIVSRSNSIQNIKLAIAEEAPRILLNILYVITCLVVLGFVDGGLLILLMVGSSLFASLMRTIGNRKAILENAYVATNFKERNIFIESIQQILSIRLSGYEIPLFTQWLNEFSQSLRARMKSLEMDRFRELVETLVLSFIRILALYILVDNVIKSQLTMGEFFSSFLLVGIHLEAVRSLCQSMNRFLSDSVHLQRLDDIMGEPVRRPIINKPADRPVLRGYLQVNNIGFRYGLNEPWLFRKLSFTARPGETIVITGKSGAGKSSLLKCLLGLYEADEGEIIYDDLALTRIGFETVTKNCAVVFQNQRVLNTSILDNVTVFETSPNMQRVEEVLRAVCLWDDIMRMQMKLDTNAALSLSGGQGQRVLIARALYSKPRILFFDEATNQLDSKTEISIMQYIKQQQMTKILIAHRKETIELGDQIISIEAPRAEVQNSGEAIHAISDS